MLNEDTLHFLDTNVIIIKLPISRGKLVSYSIDDENFHKTSTQKIIRFELFYPKFTLTICPRVNAEVTG